MKRCLSCGATFQDIWPCPKCSYSPQLIEGFFSFAPELATGDNHAPVDFQTLAGVEAGNFWFRARNRLIVWAIQHYFAHATSILEIGCGTGFVLSGIHRAFPNLALSGSEVACEGLAFAARRVPGVSLFQMDARRIPFSDEFDVVGAFDVIEHIHEDEQVLGEMYRSVRNGGGIIITVPQHSFLWSRVDEIAGHVRRYSASDLTEKITRAGFHTVRTTSFVSILLPLMMASRLATSKATGRQVANSEFGLGSLSNMVLEKLLDIERGLICCGISFPVGGSLLAVAYKI